MNVDFLVLDTTPLIQFVDSKEDASISSGHAKHFLQCKCQVRAKLECAYTDCIIKASTLKWKALVKIGNHRVYNVCSSATCNIQQLIRYVHRYN